MDLVTFGEAMVRLTPPSFQRIEQARSFDACVGGAELNVAIVAAGGQIHRAPCCEVEVIDRIGAGDAFSAGLIVSTLENKNWGEAVQFATALRRGLSLDCLALLRTVPRSSA